MWKAFALYSGAVFQLASCIVVFSFLGYRLAIRTHHSWFTVAGVIFGVIVGASGLVVLAKHMLGEKP
jgi:hypothetical protein